MSTSISFSSFNPVTGDFSPAGIETFTYPMGEPTLRGGYLDSSKIQVAYVTGTAPDWTLLGLWADLAVRSGTQDIVLVLPYLPGARGDKDRPSPAKVNARLAASLPITRLITLDPHSPVWLTEFDRASQGRIDTTILDLGQLVREAVSEYRYDAVIAPDAGAGDRARGVARALGVSAVYVAEKLRDPQTGRILSYRCNLPAYRTERLLVVDDICDGGATFELLGQFLPSGTDLWVSHAGFTKGTAAITDAFDRVMTTDSLRLPEPDRFIEITSLYPAVARALGETTEEN